MAIQIRNGDFAMMGQQTGIQPKIFYHHMNLEQRVPRTHLLRRIQEQIDFNFIYAEVRDTYGGNGNVSIPPPVILKMMLLLVLYNVRSERELMETIPMRLDWLWFLGYDIDSEVPDHSVLSKARARWGVEAFRGFFERMVWQCVEAGLVDGRKIFVDSSLVDADASNNSVIDTSIFEGSTPGGLQEAGSAIRGKEREHGFFEEIRQREQPIHFNDRSGCIDCESWQAQTLLSGTSGCG